MICRLLGSSSILSNAVPNPERAPPQTQTTEDQSFVMNMFRGQIQSNQIFPYPNVLTEEQKETLKMLVDPVEKFFDVG